MKKILSVMILGKFFISPLLANDLNFFSDFFDTITATNQPLSGFYSDKGIDTPRTIIFHDYNPESFSRVMLSFTTNTDASIFSKLWQKLSTKLGIQASMPTKISCVIQRRSLTGAAPYDLGLLRPHYALFDIPQNDPRIKGKINATAVVSSALFFSVKGEKLNISNLGGITAHPGDRGSTVLSPNNLNVSTINGQDHLFFSYVKTDSQPLLTLHYLPSQENHVILNDALLMALVEHDKTLKAFFHHFNLEKHPEIEAMKQLFLDNKFNSLLEESLS